MRNPPHPGEILRSLCLEPLHLSVTDAAKSLGISPDMAACPSIAFDMTAKSWLNQQVQYDLWRAEKCRKLPRVQRIAA